MRKRRLLPLVLMLFLSACGSQPASADVPANQTEPVTSESTETENSSATEDTEPEQNDVLVVYFSATGNTKRVAERIAAITGGELAEIVPAQLYTAEDLNYNDNTTRATVEQNNSDARPQIANDISLDGYTTVYLGYPIWWGQAPRIMSTFVESHDFTGITVIPFCTSGGSGAGNTGETLGEQAGTGTFLTSTRFNKDVSDTDLQQWIGSSN